jgi:hypothetical protein
MPSDIREEIDQLAEMNKPNFARRPNRYRRPVIQNTKIASLNASASTVFITRIPDAIDSFRQFLRPVYAIFNATERHSSGNIGSIEHASHV